MKPSVLLLCVLGALLVSSTFCLNAIGPENCCFRVYPRVIGPRRIRSYTLTDERCTRSGVIFVTQKNLNVCVDPNLRWVQDIMKKLDQSSF
ncbi:C-C motif chemokine 36.1 [Boleophthalmus pectinirostris]|uniref:C-C motif chemokine 36.1 n=1 Tax=Boleophthalmus pectinirostris TaxID=150288 RepID=UPI000A1C34D6|nr:C-C motif chemokine 36.1 [Boleophthalmus pectinirostris]